MRELLLPVDQDGGEWASLDFATATAAASHGWVTAAFHPRWETLPVVDAMGGGAIVLAKPPESRGATAQAVAPRYGPGLPSGRPICPTASNSKPI